MNDLDVLEDFSMLFLDHPFLDGILIAESNLYHFNFLKSFQYFLNKTTSFPDNNRMDVMKKLFESLTKSTEAHVFVDSIYHNVISKIDHFKCIHLSTQPAILSGKGLKVKKPKKAMIGKKKLEEGEEKPVDIKPLIVEEEEKIPVDEGPHENFEIKSSED